MTCCNRQNICMKQGDDLSVIVSVVDGSGLPIDITDAESIKWSAARSVNSVAILEKSIGDGITVNSPTTFIFDITSAESELMSGNYYHEVEIINNTGLVYTPLFGQLVIQKTLIKPE